MDLITILTIHLDNLKESQILLQLGHINYTGASSLQVTFKFPSEFTELTWK
jgi:hypothetical protein